MEHLIGQDFQTILADPPWPSVARSTSGSSMDNMAPRYKTMTATEILALPVSQIASPDSILVLWATWMHLALAMKTIDAWGFRYCAGMPWLKVTQDHSAPIFGPGVWFQGCSELVLIARRGNPFFGEFNGKKSGNPRPARKGIIIAPRQEHSRKPDELHEWIEEKLLSPRLELFARRPRKGWTVYGDEVAE